MKIQDLAIIFVIIILPISLLLSVYTQFQIQTINMQTLYDSKLTSATYDAIKAFQINTANNSHSDIATSKIKDLEASIETFKNSIMTTFELQGYSEEELNNYIPALVYTLYDGFYIYSPYNNTNYRYEKDEDGHDQPADNNGENMYGLKPYITYSTRYIKGNLDVVITYTLDNFVTVRGMIGDEYVNKSGYLIDDIDFQGNDTNYTIRYNGVLIEEEQLKEFLPLAINGVLPEAYPYVKINGTKYYDFGNDTIGYIANGTLYTQKKSTNADYGMYMALIKNNNSAKEYYKKASNFTYWFKNNLADLTYADVYDEVIDADGNISIKKIWKDDDIRKIFQFSTDSTNMSDNIENELSSFNEHRLEIIKHKIETNMAIAISNYNNYSGVTSNVFQMPELKENEWDNITHNISVISFLQGLPIGGKIYNGYTLVTDSQSKEVVLEKNIYLMGTDGTYHRIGDNGFEEGTVAVTSGIYGYDFCSAGRLNLDFERNYITYNEDSRYYYPLKRYNASYNSIVMQNNVTTYDDIYQYVNTQNYDYKLAFYTALARERECKYSEYNDKSIYGGFSADRLCLVTLEPGEGTEFIDTRIAYVVVGDNYGDWLNNQPTKKGYQFMGWFTQPGGAGIRIESDDVCEQPGEITLYAHFEKITYTLIFQANGVELPQYTRTIEYGESYDLPVIDETRDIPESKYFVRWLYHGKEIRTGMMFDPIGTVPTQYVIAELATRMYTITYDANGGTGAPDPDIKEHGVDITLPEVSEEPTRDGYRFLGWSPSQTDTSIIYKSGTTYANNADITLFAVWQAKYTISYDANGGEGAPALQIKYYDEGINLREEIPTRDGYKFFGWSTNKNSVTATYQPGDMFEINSNTTLFAVWKKIYTITYDANKGTGAPASHPKYHGQNVSLSTTEPTRSNYKFVGWDTNKNATTATYQPGGNFTIDADTTLYAIWQQIYTISYDTRGGSTAPASQTKYHGEPITLSSTVPTKPNYIFLGWNKSAAASTATYAAGATYSEEGDATLYAIWQEDTYIVLYKPNRGTGTEYPVSKTIGQNMTIEDNEFVAPSNSHFLKWNTKEDGTGKSYYPGDTYKFEGENKMTLYAIWETHTDECYDIDTHTHTAACNYHEHTSTTGSCYKVKPHTHSEEGGSCYRWEVWDLYCSNCGEGPGAHYAGNPYGACDNFTKWEGWRLYCDKTNDGYELICKLKEGYQCGLEDNEEISRILTCGGTP